MATIQPSANATPSPGAGMLHTALVDKDGMISRPWLVQWNRLWSEVFGGSMQSPIRIVAPSLLPTSPAPLYRAAAAINLTTASCTNTTSTAVTLSLYFVPLGASPGAANQVLSQSIPPNSTVALQALLSTPGQILAAGEILYGAASTAGALTLLISGVPT